MTDDEINRKFDVVAQHLANAALNHEQAVERIDRIERQIEHLGNALMQLTEAHTETQQTTTEMQRTMSEMQRAMARLADSQAKLADSQTRTDRRQDALIDIVRERREGREEKGGET